MCLLHKLHRLTAAYQKSPAKSQAGVRLPIHWRKMKVTDVDVIKLDVTDAMQKQEYDDIEKHFKDTLDGELNCIKRIQNPLLWEHYTL